MRQPEPRRQRLRRSRDQLLERLLGPRDLAFGRALERSRALFPRAFGLLLRLPLLDDVLGRLGDHAPAVVEPAPARAPGDLLELADRKKAHLRPVELRELREEDRPDRDVHADTERVGPADDVQEPLLGELLHEKAVLGKEPGVVNAAPEREESPELLAVGCCEAPPAHDLPDLLSLLAAPDLHPRQRLREPRA